MGPCQTSTIASTTATVAHPAAYAVTTHTVTSPGPARDINLRPGAANVLGKRLVLLEYLPNPRG